MPATQTWPVCCTRLIATGGVDQKSSVLAQIKGGFPKEEVPEVHVSFFSAAALLCSCILRWVEPILSKVTPHRLCAALCVNILICCALSLSLSLSPLLCMQTVWNINASTAGFFFHALLLRKHCYQQFAHKRHYRWHLFPRKWVSGKQLCALSADVSHMYKLFPKTSTVEYGKSVLTAPLQDGLAASKTAGVCS